MAQNHIPPFPNPRNGDDVNYTECFNIAREERIAGMTVDPNDSNQNPKTNPAPPPPPTKTKSEGHRPANIAREERIAGMTVDPNDSNQNQKTKSEGHRPVKASTRPDPQHCKDKSDDGASRQKSTKDSSRAGPSPLHPAHESKSSRKDVANPPTHNSRHRQHRDQRDDGSSSHRRPSKASSRGPSPLHPSHESKSPRSDRANPFAERAPSDGRGGSHTPGRSRRKHAGAQGYEPQKEDHYAIPPFTNFDGNNAENITDLFKRAKNDLSSASPNVHAQPTYQTTEHDKSSQKSCSCCAIM